MHYKSYRGGTTYSENEQRIGTWIDGKPIYRSLISKNKTLTHNDHIDVSKLNVDKVLRFIGSCKQTSTTSPDEYPFPYASSETSMACYYNRTGDLVRYVGTTIYEACIMMEYTKTTDKSGG